MYETRWATDGDRPLLTEYWYRMACEMAEKDSIPKPTEQRTAEVDRLFAAELVAGTLAFHVALDQTGTIIACAGGLLRTEYPTPLSEELVPFGWVIAVYTLPEHRGYGLATQLVDEVCTWLSSRGARRARLWASSDGRPVYERMGFRPMMDMAKPL
jgi:GNAT superfamily N-acetyltransferase